MIDWTQVDGLREDLGDGFGELVDVFLAEMDEAMGRLDHAAPPAQMAADMHFLKGASLNLGLDDFAALCAAAETGAEAGQQVDLAPILASFEASRQAFVEGLERRRVA